MKRKVKLEGTRFRVRKSDAKAVTKLILRNGWAAEKANMGRDVRFDIEGDDKEIMNAIAKHGIIISHLDESASFRNKLDSYGAALNALDVYVDKLESVPAPKKAKKVQDIMKKLHGLFLSKDESVQPPTLSRNEAFGDLNDAGFKKISEGLKHLDKVVKKLQIVVKKEDAKETIKLIKGLYDIAGIMYDMIGVPRFYESVNEIETLGASGLKSFAKKHKYSVRSKKSGGRVPLMYLSKDGKQFGPFDPTILTKKYLLKKLGLNERIERNEVHAETKKELKAAIAKSMREILDGKTPKYDIINGMSGEMIGWKDGKDYIWQPSAIPYAERELK